VERRDKSDSIPIAAVLEDRYRVPSSPWVSGLETNLVCYALLSANALGSSWFFCIKKVGFRKSDFPAQ
jgi:hypothetical protein